MQRRKQQERDARLKEVAASIRGADLFCGVGGLTRGLETTGISVELGIDIDPACEYGVGCGKGRNDTLRANQRLFYQRAG